jgi:hypothetical protein
MNAPVFALLYRGMRQDSRDPRTYVLRALVAVVMIFACMAIAGGGRWMGAPGLVFFSVLAWADFVALCILGIGFFSPMIAAEKEQGTLGLVKITGLDPASIVLGMAGPPVAGVGLLLLAQVPFALLSVTLGGLLVGQIFAVYVTLASFTILVAGLAIFCSVVCARPGNAQGLAGFLLFGFLLLPVMPLALRGLGMAQDWLAVGDPLYTALGTAQALLGQTSPVVRMLAVMSISYAGGPFGWQTLINILLGAMFFALAWRLFEPMTANLADAAPGRAVPVAQPAVYRVSARTAQRRPWLSFIGPGRAWDNAIAWKEFHFVAGGPVMLMARVLVLAVIACLLAISLYYLGHGFDSDFRQLFGGLLMGSTVGIMGFEMLAHGGRIYGEEIKWRTLPDLILLPVSGNHITDQKLRGVAFCLLPYVPFFLLGALAWPEGFLRAFVWLVSHTMVWALLFYAVFWYFMVLFISVLPRRGASLLNLAWGLLLTLVTVFPLPFIANVSRVWWAQILGLLFCPIVIHLIRYTRCMLAGQVNHMAGNEEG